MANENKYLNYQGVQTLWSAVNNKKQNKIFSGTGAPSATTAPNAVDGDVYLDLSGGIALDNTSSALINLIYPIGSIYQTMDENFDPNTAFGGTWEEILGKFLFGDAITNVTGGEAEVLLNANQCGLPAHTHPDATFYTMRRSTAATSLGSTNMLAAGDNTEYSSAQGASTQAALTALNLNSSYERPEMRIHIATAEPQNARYAHNNMPPYITVKIWQRIA